MINQSAWKLILVPLLWASLALGDSPNIPSGQLLGGSPGSPVQIEVFSDFQCSACRELYLGTIRQVLQDYSSKNKVCVIYHEFPLSYHKYSREAARYAEAASRLGLKQSLAVRDALFMDQPQWSQNGNLEASISKALPKEDFQKLKKILQDSGINLAIERDLDLAAKRQIRSTPTMFIRYAGKQQKVEGHVPYVVLKQFIDSILK